MNTDYLVSRNIENKGGQPRITLLNKQSSQLYEAFLKSSFSENSFTNSNTSSTNSFAFDKLDSERYSNGISANSGVYGNNNKENAEGFNPILMSKKKWKVNDSVVSEFLRSNESKLNKVREMRNRNGEIKFRDNAQKVVKKPYKGLNMTRQLSETDLKGTHAGQSGSDSAHSAPDLLEKSHRYSSDQSKRFMEDKYKRTEHINEFQNQEHLKLLYKQQVSSYENDEDLIISGNNYKVDQLKMYKLRNKSHRKKYKQVQPLQMLPMIREITELSDSLRKKSRQANINPNSNNIGSHNHNNIPVVLPNKQIYSLPKLNITDHSNSKSLKSYTSSSFPLISTTPPISTRRPNPTKLSSSNNTIKSDSNGSFSEMLDKFLQKRLDYKKTDWTSHGEDHRSHDNDFNEAKQSYDNHYLFHSSTPPSARSNKVNKFNINFSMNNKL